MDHVKSPSDPFYLFLRPAPIPTKVGGNGMRSNYRTSFEFTRIIGYEAKPPDKIKGSATMSGGGLDYR
jgi:hypothetical protein